MRRTVRWLARLLPPDYYLAIALLIYLVIECFAWSEARDWKDFLWPANNVSVQDLFKVRDAMLVMAAGFYGVWHVAAFHPFYRQSYAEWLKFTPWTSRLPLPRGPLHLTLQDVVVAGILVAAMHSSFSAALLVPVMLLAAHSMAAGLALFWTRPRGAAYAIGFLFGLLLVASEEIYVALAVAAVMSLVAHLGTRASLARFPWESSEGLTEVTRFVSMMISRHNEAPKGSLGYPFDGLSPRVPEPLPLADGIALSLLPAWWAYAASVAMHTPDHVPLPAIMICLYLLPACVIGRLLKYLTIYRPPISLWGRILTGRWIIPSYDRALVAPLLATILGFATPIECVRNRVPLELIPPACIAAVLLILLNMGPSLRAWRLTGGYRLVPYRDRKNLIEL